jgi:hypothetical protein
MIRATICEYRVRLCLSAACLLVFQCAAPAVKEPKLKAEELVARHLNSIGTPEARAAVKDRVEDGTAEVTFHLPTSGRLPGTGSIVSAGTKIRIVMAFGSQNYQAEQLVFDGSSVDTGQLQLRQRSVLSDFVYHHDVLLKEGLLCGTMTTAWPLLDLAARQPKLDYIGLKKVAGKQLHELRYRARKDAGDVQISLYFDPESYRHVYSQYRLAVRTRSMGSRARPTMSDPGTASPADQMETYYKIEEWFDDFRVVDSLNLPHAYRMRFNVEGPSPFLYEFSINLSKILHNQEVDPTAFVVR